MWAKPNMAASLACPAGCMFVASVVEKQKGRRWPDCEGPTAKKEKNKGKEKSRRRLLDFSPTVQLITQGLAGIATGRRAGVGLETSSEACG